MSRKVIITAYACEPGKGSEIGVVWNWVKLIADNYDETFVITRAANKATINDSPLELSGVNFIYHDLPRWATFWKKGVRGIYLYYFLWIKMSQNKVNRIINQNQISTSFHLTYGNALLPIIKTRNIRTGSLVLLVD